MKKINLIIYGATGSIGNSTLSLIRQNKNLFKIQGITCNKNVKKIKNIANEFNVKKIGIGQVIKNKNNLFENKKVFVGIDEFSNMVDEKTDVIIFAISGTKALKLVRKLVQFGKKIGLANKESIISLGNNLLDYAKKFKTELIPLDSEHNSIFHLLKNNKDKFKSITITASGGPFLKKNVKDFKSIKVKDALKHPIWKMGKKITIDSATLMNKSLEIIEAKYLFDLKISMINTIIHPQSIIHALINYENGITTALLNVPDMQIPISTVFFKFDYPNQEVKNLDLLKYKKLEFQPVDKKKFPAIDLGYEVIKMGGLAPNCFNFLNELLVHNFLRENIGFNDIVELNRTNLEHVFAKNKNINNPSIDDIENINIWIENNLYLGSR